MPAPRKGEKGKDTMKHHNDTAAASMRLAWDIYRKQRTRTRAAFRICLIAAWESIRAGKPYDAHAAFTALDGPRQHTMLLAMTLHARDMHDAIHGYDSRIHHAVSQDMDAIINTAWIKAERATRRHPETPLALTAYRAASAAMMQTARDGHRENRIDKNADVDTLERTTYPAPESAALASWALTRAARDELDAAIIDGMEAEATTRELATLTGLSQTAIVKRIAAIKRRISADLYDDEREDMRA